MDFAVAFLGIVAVLVYWQHCQTVSVVTGAVLGYWQRCQTVSVVIVVILVSLVTEVIPWLVLLYLQVLYTVNSYVTLCPI